MEINENVLWSVCELILAVRSESLELGLSVDVNFISLTPHWWSSVIFIRTHKAKESRALISLSENHTRDSFAFDSPLAFHPCDPHPWPFLPKFCANYEIRTSSFNYFRLSIWKADVGLCLHYRTMQDTHTHTHTHTHKPAYSRWCYTISWVYMDRIYSDAVRASWQFTNPT